MLESAEDILAQAVNDAIASEEVTSAYEDLERLENPWIPDAHEFMLSVVSSIDAPVFAAERFQIEREFKVFVSAMKSIVNDVKAKVHISQSKETNEPGKASIYHAYPSEYTKKCPDYYTGLTVRTSWDAIYQYHFLVKFNVSNETNEYNRIRMLCRLFALIRSFQNRIQWNRREIESYRPYFFRNNNEEWELMSKEPFHIETAGEFWKNADAYRRSMDVKVIFYYKDFFCPDASIEETRHISSVFESIMRKREKIRRKYQ